MADTPSLKGLGPKTREKLEKLGIFSNTDLVNHFPSRYIDFSHTTPISECQINENTTITGQVVEFKNIFTRYGKNIQKCLVRDKTGFIYLIWFNQPYLSKNIKVGDTLSFAGTITLFQNKLTIVAPEYGQYNTGKIIAVYPETRGLSSKWFRKTIQSNIFPLTQDAIDLLPLSITKKFKLLDKKNSLIQIHTPTNFDQLAQARNRLAIDEILSLQAHSLLNRQSWLSKKPKIIFKTNKSIDKKIDSFINDLPFQLTDSQQKVWSEIKTDLLSTTTPSNRLIQGDVGSGKTVVALLACYLAHLNNQLSIFVAPTEILAQQHYKSFHKLLENTLNIPIFLLTGSTKIDLSQIPKNSIIIATHAVIFQKQHLESKTSLIIIDEQHKFGVKQRSFLSESLNPPHCLTMTATPIPRTISLTMLGNLSLSHIDTLPQNRLPIKTYLVPNNKQTDCYQWLDKHINDTQQQAFIVCPFIDASENMTSVKSATQEFETLQKIFPKQKLGLLHGKLKISDKEKILKDFKDNKINILVTTPIIEVGVDIPNSTTIIIQSADRFGLAQLHQLRGRVGRGGDQSFCYLFTDSQNDKTLSRLKFLEKNTNGLKIAEFDLANRGPGEIFSIVQHGFPSLRLANISDAQLISQSQQILENILKDDPKFNLMSLIKNSSDSTAFSLNN